MRFSKTSKRVLSLAMTAAVAASSVAVASAPKKAEAADIYALHQKPIREYVLTTTMAILN